jgi:hypothetical protein
LNVQHLFIGDFLFFFFFSVTSPLRVARDSDVQLRPSSCFVRSFLFFGCGPGRRRSIVSAQSRRWGSKYILFHYYY